ncbi:putative ABC transporter permease protein [Microbacterium sp. TS-1]|uniref:carbohydrate ABC transporter permease n=1 Tax=unclassified Microbacterium TaxID=2609290 RepID=UPI00038F35B8|nr:MULTISPECIES: sugar ABC transporter permease [unclassified Microbacterium]GAD33446.1 putative ABC transporter permease protein [Microbacterium sp. TS-1]
MTPHHRGASPTAPWSIGLASALVPGLGQVLNREWVKGIALAVVAALAVAVELTTGHYADIGEYTPRTHGGFFVRGLWGLVTLGTQPRAMTVAGLSAGDHSIILMINGIIAVLVLSLLLALAVWAVRDAAKTRRRFLETGERVAVRAWVRDARQRSFPYLVLAPTVVLLLFVTALPVAFGILIAFTDYSKDNLPPMQLVEWVGLANFRQLLGAGAWGATFFGVLGWTIAWAALATATTYVFGFLQAVLVSSRRVRFPRVWRSIFFLPWAVPAMISALVFRSMFNGQFGPISQALVDWGMTSERVMWLTDPANPWLARIIALLVNLWLGFPYFMALVSGALTNISPSYYEAARIDGASAAQQVRYITLPIVLRATAPLIVLSFVANFNNFGVIYFLTQGGPANPDYRYAGSTDILITWLYKLTLDNGLYDIASVMSILIFVIVGSFSVWSLRRSKAFTDA